MTGSDESAARVGPALAIAVGLAVAGVCLVFFMIAAFALPVVFSAGGDGVFSWQWLPAKNRFGILPMLVGSLLLAGGALLFAWPLAVGFSSWTLTAKPGLARRLAQSMVRAMTAVPTVVYGFAALFLLTPRIRAGFGGSGLCWLSATFVLAILIFPTLVLVMQAGMSARFDALGRTPAALGFTPAQSMAHFVLPRSGRALATAAVLGFGRAVGDTLVPLMLAGNAPQIPAGPTESVRALTAHMALVTANAAGDAAYDSLFVAGAIVLLLSGGAGFAVRACEKRLAGGAR